MRWTFSASKGGGDFRSLLCHHTGQPPVHSLSTDSVSSLTSSSRYTSQGLSFLVLEDYYNSLLTGLPVSSFVFVRSILNTAATMIDLCKSVQSSFI